MGLVRERLDRTMPLLVLKLWTRPRDDLTPRFQVPRERE